MTRLENRMDDKLGCETAKLEVNEQKLNHRLDVMVARLEKWW